MISFRYMKPKKRYNWAAYFLLILFFVSPIVVEASCGNVITQYDYGDGLIDELTPIVNCANPFNADSPEPFTYELTLAGQVVTASSVILVVEGESATGTFSIDKPDDYGVNKSLDLFKKEGNDYRLIDSSYSSGNFTFGTLEPGEYVAALNYSFSIGMMQAEPVWKTWLKKVFLPTTAYAFYGDETEVIVIPFTIEYTIPAPLGASSVLFLPGIQASRLYMDEGGDENQLWEPNVNVDVEKLAMTANGESVNDIYTKDVIDEVNVLPLGQSNIYKSFLSNMEGLVSEGIINDFNSFAYDWRYSVFDVAIEEVDYKSESKRLLDEVLALADNSYTGKVTLIGHSNGGLVAKALLEEYGDTFLAGKVDKLIMIGTPQLGTPKAIGSMLHGLDQSLGYGLIASADTVRQVTKNLPGAYTLLPSPRYFEEVSDSIITTDDSDLAESVSAYGDIDSANKLRDFLVDSLNTREEINSLNNPIILNNQFIAEASAYQAILDDWQAPAGVEVYEVVGTGLATTKGYEYREYGCSSTENALCILNSYLKPFPILSNDGDQTVMAISAEGYEGGKTTVKINLYEEEFFKPKTHKDITESDNVQKFVDSVIKYPYVIEAIEVPEFSEVYTKYRIVSVHSPVVLLATSPDGKQVGVMEGEIREEVRGSQYFELGDSKYLILPYSVNFEVEVTGTGEGVYTLEIDELSETNEQSQISKLIATTTEQMTAHFSIAADKYSSIKTDIDGDGEIDVEQTLNGEIILPPNTSYSYQDLKSAIKSLSLNKKYEKGLLLQVQLAELFNKKSQHSQFFTKLEKRILDSLSKNLKLYGRKGIISEADVKLIEEIIKNLK